MPYVSPKGLRYYLPAFMVWELHLYIDKKPIDDFALYALDMDHTPEELKLREHRFSLFTPEQLHACSEFVRLCANDTGELTDTWFAQDQYRLYWFRYENK